MGRVFALSFHADYKCANSGICCSSDWDVPVELPIYKTLSEALESGRLAPAGDAYENDPPLITGDDLPDGAAAMLARTDTGDCVFFHRDSHLCVVHRDAGETQLPSTCRHFPRLAVHDARGTFISLTHYCPTAAASLFRHDTGLAIVESPPAFPEMDYEGLSVGPDDWPPLLRRRMLMDLDGYGAWERHMVNRCADLSLPPDTVLATLRRDAALLARFRPGSSTLSAAVSALPAAAVSTGVERSLALSLELRRAVVTAIPDDLKPVADEHELDVSYERFVRGAWNVWAVPLKRYLAAKAFANWTAYQGRGVMAIIRGLESAMALVRIEAARRCRNASAPLDLDRLRESIRAADFMLNHLAVGEDLAQAWSAAEENCATTGP